MIESVVLVQSPRPGGWDGFFKPNYQALFGPSLDPPETKMRGGASSLALPAYNI